MGEFTFQGLPDGIGALRLVSNCWRNLSNRLDRTKAARSTVQLKRPKINLRSSDHAACSDSIVHFSPSISARPTAAGAKNLSLRSVMHVQISLNHLPLHDDGVLKTRAVCGIDHPEFGIALGIPWGSVDSKRTASDRYIPLANFLSLLCKVVTSWVTCPSPCRVSRICGRLKMLPVASSLLIFAG